MAVATDRVCGQDLTRSLKGSIHISEDQYKSGRAVEAKFPVPRESRSPKFLKLFLLYRKSLNTCTFDNQLFQIVPGQQDGLCEEQSHGLG